MLVVEKQKMQMLPYRVQVAKLFEEYENDVNNMLWPLQSPDFNPTEHL